MLEQRCYGNVALSWRVRQALESVIKPGVLKHACTEALKAICFLVMKRNFVYPRGEGQPAFMMAFLAEFGRIDLVPSEQPHAVATKGSQFNLHHLFISRNIADAPATYTCFSCLLFQAWNLSDCPSLSLATCTSSYWHYRILKCYYHFAKLIWTELQDAARASKFPASFFSLL